MENKFKTEIAKEKIKQAVSIKEGLWNSNEDKTILEVMTYHVGDCLVSLLSDGSMELRTDWVSKMYSYQFFLKSLLAAFTKPGMIEKLPEQLQETTGEMLQKLISFFEELDEGHTVEYLKYFTIDQYCSYEEEYLDRVIEHYDFEKAIVGTEKSNYFSEYTLPAQRLQAMQKDYKAIGNG